MTGGGGDSNSLAGAVLSRRFRLTRKLGAGGMAAVYAADDQRDGRSVAVKILHPEFLGELTVLSRFLEEARTSQRLVHPNIVHIFEAAEAEDGTPYLVMELLDGVPLGAYTGGGSRVPPAQAVPILQGVLAALAHAHGLGVVHRDLKPDNVFLTRQGGQFAVKVLDFGIAKVMDAAGGMGSRTKTGLLLGTPAYMSPEQVRNAKDVDGRADVWSAGVMLYEMLSGRVAFPAPTEYARLSAILTSTPPGLESLDPALARFGAVIRRAMEKDRELRFATALAFAQGLSEALGGTAAKGPLPEGAPTEGQAGGAGAAALSRLPEVPSVLLPSQVPGRGVQVTGEGRRPSPPPPEPTSKTPGGTLASPSSPPVAELPPNVVVLPPGQGGGTLPSQDLPMLEPVASGAPRLALAGSGRGVPPVAVVLLVLAGVLAGVLFGYLVGRH